LLVIATNYIYAAWEKKNIWYQLQIYMFQLILFTQPLHLRPNLLG